MPTDQAAYEIIERTVANGEGGWKLSRDADGGDGGWTFGGITKKTYDATMIAVHDGFVGMNYEDIEKEALLNSAKFKRFKLDCVKIYKFMYWDKLHLDQLMLDHCKMVYSCGINCGVGTTIKMMQDCMGIEKPDGVWGPASQKQYDQCYLIFKNCFLKCWMHHYISIVQHNPEKLQFLMGWFNRVESFR